MAELLVGNPSKPQHSRDARRSPGYSGTRPEAGALALCGARRV